MPMNKNIWPAIAVGSAVVVSYITWYKFALSEKAKQKALQGAKTKVPKVSGKDTLTDVEQEIMEAGSM